MGENPMSTWIDVVGWMTTIGVWLVGLYHCVAFVLTCYLDHRRYDA